MSTAFLCSKTSEAALSRPPIAPAWAGADTPLRLADACRMGGRSKPGYDEISNDFNHIKYFSKIVFPLKNLYLYSPDDLWHAHAPDFSRRRSGAFARAENAVRGRSSKKFSKTDEQFCCRSFDGTDPRQPQRRGRPAAQSQRDTARQALGRTTGPSRRSQIDDPLCERALRPGEGFAQSASGVPT